VEIHVKRAMFILGAGGFVGRRLVDEALAANWKVKALVRSAENARQIAAKGASWFFIRTIGTDFVGRMNSAKQSMLAKS